MTGITICMTTVSEALATLPSPHRIPPLSVRRPTWQTDQPQRERTTVDDNTALMFEPFGIEELDVLEVPQGVALPEMGASKGSTACCSSSSSSSSCCCC
jgi:thiazolylpeptide-type bacteriocin precursor